MTISRGRCEALRLQKLRHHLEHGIDDQPLLIGSELLDQREEFAAVLLERHRGLIVVIEHHHLRRADCKRRAGVDEAFVHEFRAVGLEELDRFFDVNLDLLLRRTLRHALSPWMNVVWYRFIL